MQDALAFAPHDHDACIASALAVATERCAARGARLTPIRRRVLEILLEAHTALGAYDILARLGAEGYAAQPPRAYRALAFLQVHGLVHRVERLNAFVACATPGTRHDPVLLICRGCGRVGEAQADGRLADATGDFAVADASVEAEGLCPPCQSAA